jgi:hypothetical protein
MHGNDQAGQRKEPDAARFRADAFACSGFCNRRHVGVLSIMMRS